MGSLSQATRARALKYIHRVAGALIPFLILNLQFTPVVRTLPLQTARGSSIITLKIALGAILVRITFLRGRSSRQQILILNQIAARSLRLEFQAATMYKISGAKFIVIM